MRDLYFKGFIPKADDAFVGGYLTWLVLISNLVSFIVGIIVFLILSIPLLFYIIVRVLTDLCYDGLKKIWCNTGKNRNI